ncbi:MAG: glycosyltransferase family 39 protein [Chloroflexota bacterium]
MSPRAYLCLWLIACLPRLALAIVFFHHPIALDDMYQYDMLARSILAGNGYRWYSQADLEVLRPYYSQFVDLDEIHVPPEGLETTFRAPGYPLFLALIYSLTPEEERFGWARVVQALFTALLSPISALIAIRSGLRPRTATLAGLGIAFYPILLFYPVGLASENLFIPLLAVSFLALLQTIKTNKWLPTVLSGILLAACMLTRSICILFAILGVVWAYFSHRLDRQKAAVVLLIVFGLCLPWSIRNTRLMHKPTFVETSLGYNLFVSYHPEGNGGFVSEVAIQSMTILDDAERDRYTLQSTWGFILNDPGEALLRLFRRAAFYFGVEDRELLYFYGNNFFGNIPQPWLLLSYLWLITPWLGTLFLSPLGLLLASDRQSVSLFLLLFMGYALPHFFILSEPRFHLALVPAMMPFAVYACVALINKPSCPSHPWLKSRFLGIVLPTWIILTLLTVWNFALHWNRLLAIMGPEGHKIYPSY